MAEPTWPLVFFPEGEQETPLAVSGNSSINKGTHKDPRCLE